MEDGSANRHARGWTIAVALVVLLVAFALRVNGLTAGGLHLDEGYSLIQSERSVIDIFALNRFDANPPFYILTLHLWRTLFGDGEWALKSLGMMAGVVGVAAIGLAARVRFGVTAGLAAAWFVALNAFHLQQSQEIRGYSLLLAAVALADFAFVRWFETGSRRALFGFALATFYAVNVHHFAWGFALVQMGSVLIRPRSEAQRRDIARVLLGVVVLSLPMLASFAIHLVVHQSQSWIPLRGLDGLLGVLGEIAGRDAFAVLAGLLALLGGVGAAFPKQRLAALGSFVSPELETDRVRAVAVPALQLTLPVVLFVGSYLLFPMLLARYCVITILPLGVLVGAGAAALRPRLLLLIACAALLVLARGPIVAEYANELRLADQQRWSEIVRDEYREGDVVLYTDKYVFVPAIALHPPEMHEYLMPRLEGRNVSTVLEHYTVRTVRREPLRPGEFERAWIVKRPNEPLDRVLRDPMLAGTRPRLIRRVRETEIYLFALPASR